MFTVAQQRRLCDASICAVSGNLITGQVVHEMENVRLAEGCD